MDVQIDKRDGVLSITLARPAKKNALTGAMYQAMADALAAAREDKEVRVIVLRGSGGSFSAGNDLEDFLKTPPAGDAPPVIQFLNQISTAAKPVVAAVSGVAVGIGTTMLLHCDLVYADETARFSLPFATLGLCPEAASSLLLPRLAGHQVAAEKLLLGEAFDAQEAFRIGLVNRVLPAAELDEYVAKQVAKLVALPSASLRLTKALLKQGGDDVAARMNQEFKQFGAMLRAPEAREAMTAFFEKRKPDFRQFD